MEPEHTDSPIGSVTSTSTNTSDQTEYCNKWQQQNKPKAPEQLRAQNINSGNKMETEDTNKGRKLQQEIKGQTTQVTNKRMNPEESASSKDTDTTDSGKYNGNSSIEIQPTSNASEYTPPERSNH